MLIVKEHDPFKYLLDEDNFVRTIRECIDNDDPKGVIEVIEIYLDALERSKFLKNVIIPQASGLKGSSKIDTLIKVVRVSHADTKA